MCIDDLSPHAYAFTNIVRYMQFGPTQHVQSSFGSSSSIAHYCTSILYLPAKLAMYSNTAKKQQQPQQQQQLLTCMEILQGLGFDN